MASEVSFLQSLHANIVKILVLFQKTETAIIVLELYIVILRISVLILLIPILNLLLFHDYISYHNCDKLKVINQLLSTMLENVFQTKHDKERKKNGLVTMQKNFSIVCL